MGGLQTAARDAFCGGNVQTFHGNQYSLFDLLSNVFCLQDPQNSERNRGFAFVEYYNHACAEHSRRVLSSPGFKLGTNTPTINWADSPSGLDHPSSSQVGMLFS